jgi:hypothetical protein
MADLKTVMRALSKGTPIREIERQLGLSRRSITVYRDRAEASGRSFLELSQTDESELNVLLCKENTHKNRDEERYAFLQAHLEEYAQRMKRRYMTYEILYYEDYCKQTDNPYGYTQFKLILKEYEKNHDYKFHNRYDPAGEMQADFAGDNLWVTDPATGEHIKAYVLVCVLPFSMMCFVIAMLSTKMEFFFNGLTKALEYFRGVPDLVKSDNMSQWVKKYDRYEPSLNEAAMQWALHNGTEMGNCRSRKPRDKGPAESLVMQVYDYFYSRIMNYGPGGGHEEFFSIYELNARLRALNDQYCQEVMKSHGYSRAAKYEEEELPYMKPLPPTPYAFKYVKEFTVPNNYHVAIDGAKYYSIPYQYVGQKAKAIYDAETIEIWVDFQRVWTHTRMYRDDYYTIPEHMPENHRAYANTKERNAAYYIRMAGYVGPQTREVVENILKSKPFVQQSYKACEGILRLARQYGDSRMEAACRRIEPKRAANYGMVRNILEKGLDTGAMYGADASAPYIPANDNVRGPEAYQ